MVLLPTFGYDYVDDVMVTVHKAVDPSEEDWSRMVADLAAKLRELRGNLVLAGDIKLTARQRKGVADAVRGSKLKVAVLTESAVTRGILRAIGWLGGPPGLRPSAMEEIGGALEYLEIRGSQRVQVYGAIEKLRTSLNHSSGGSSSPS
jgi:hypothetical protein